ncbi:hypothetical protein FOZ62_010791, partial [Perkinsus olseni]
LWAGSMERIVRDPVTKKVVKEKIPLDLRWVEGQRSSKPVVPSAEDHGRNGNSRLQEWNKCDYSESLMASPALRRVNIPEIPPSASTNLVWFLGDTPCSQQFFVMTEESTAGSARLVEDLSVTEWIRLCLTGITFFATSCSMTLQGIFSIPFAIKMGLSESLSSLVWLCGPITGMIVQPLIGRWSDRYVSHSSRRSRAPFLIVGALALSVCTVIIGYSVEVGALLGDQGPPHIGGFAVLIIIFWIYDAAANVVMVVSRSALVDVAPSEHLSAGFFTQTF